MNHNRTPVTKTISHFLIFMCLKECSGWQFGVCFSSAIMATIITSYPPTSRCGHPRLQASICRTQILLFHKSLNQNAWNRCSRLQTTGSWKTVLFAHPAMKSSGVQELKSASGMDFLFIGVSKVTLEQREREKTTPLLIVWFL